MVLGPTDAVSVGDRPGGHHQLAKFDLGARVEYDTSSLNISCGT
jgi:hypothetical protein